MGVDTTETTDMSTTVLGQSMLDGAKVYGLESLELEFRFQMVHPSLAASLERVLSASPAFVPCPSEHTKESYARTGECRRIAYPAQEGRSDVYLYKKRLAKENRAPPVSVTVSLERPGDPPVDETFPVYREKFRSRWAYRCWEIHLTRFRTNDARFADADSALWDIEIELQTDHQDVYMYTLDALIAWGDRLCEELRDQLEKT